MKHDQYQTALFGDISHRLSLPTDFAPVHPNYFNVSRIYLAKGSISTPERIKLVIAWTNLDVKRAEKLTDFKSESEKDTWEWLWENAMYSKGEVNERTGTHLSEIALDAKLKPLIGNRVIYPDGTVNSYVQRYLREQVVKLFDTKPKRLAEKD